MKKNLLLTLALGAMMGMSASAATHNVYVANLTDWGTDVALYSWGDSEIFGGWPGATPSATETISNVKYDKFVINGHDGEVAHLIFNNNNNGLQVDFPEVTLNAENYYFATNGIDVHQYTDPTKPEIEFEVVDTYVYVLDKTGWDALYVYAWATNQAEVFGGWPGAALNETVTIAGETYKRAPFPGNGSITYNLIFNNNNGTQVEGVSANSGTDAYFEVTATDVKAIPTPGVETYNIYIQDNTGWDALYLYAYSNDKPSIFGAWPGVKVTETATVDGVTYKVIKDVEATDQEQTFIFNNNAGAQEDVEGSYIIDGDLYLKAGVSSTLGNIAVDDNAAPEYYNLQGIRVVNPVNGVFICRQGSKVTKVVK